LAGRRVRLIAAVAEEVVDLRKGGREVFVKLGTDTLARGWQESCRWLIRGRL
jgi:hypothetical protein